MEYWGCTMKIYFGGPTHKWLMSFVKWWIVKRTWVRFLVKQIVLC